MSLFETTLALLAVAVVLMQLAKKLRVPYPSLLALVGGCVAALPFAPRLSIEPRLALALFVAPAVLDTAFELPPREMLRNWVPLVSLAVMLVLATTAAVAWAGVILAGLPLAAAVVLGAIVAPPDAAAAAAVLREFALPRRAMSVLQGESLLNDAVALLVFGIAVTVADSPGEAWGASVPGLLVAVPGGALVGVAMGLFGARAVGKVAGTLSMIVLQFLMTYGTWILAERLTFSPITAVIALAAMASRNSAGKMSARDRVNSNAVWAIVVFVLNVLAFLMMGLQARVIFDQLQGAALLQALQFSAIVLAVVIGVRFFWVMSYGIILRYFRGFFDRRVTGAAVPSVNVGVLVSWCGMRGLVTLATAFSLPPQFPHRDVVVLSAFSVVLGTLIIQGFTIRPLIALLRIAPDTSLDEDVARIRIGMVEAALDEIKSEEGAGSAELRSELEAVRAGSADRSRPKTAYDEMRLRAVDAERRYLSRLRSSGDMSDDTYRLLEDELDRSELHAASLGTTYLDG